MRVVKRYSGRCYVDVALACLMPNHFHLAIVPKRRANVPEFMRCLGISYTLYINKRYQLVGHVFQGKYQSKEIRSSSGIVRLVNYIKDNPVKDGLVKNARDYRWLEIRSDILRDIKVARGVAKKSDR